MADQGIQSTWAVRDELERFGDDLSAWCKQNRILFPAPNTDELNFIRTIFQVTRFQSMISRQNILEGRDSADPYVIARARCVDNGCVVTTEKDKPNSAKIPTVCKYFEIPCINLEQFMRKENWQF